MLGEQACWENQTRCQETERDLKKTGSPTPHALILVLRRPLVFCIRTTSVGPRRLKNARQALRPLRQLHLIQHGKWTQLNCTGTGWSRRRPHRHGKLRHWFRDEELASVPRKPACSGVCFLAPRAVGADAGAGIHLAVKLGEENKGHPGAQCRRAIRTFPDMRKSCRSDPIPPGSGR